MGRALAAHGVKILRHDFHDRQMVVINVLSDLHFGHPLVQEERLKRCIQYVQERGHFLLLNGDLIECVTRTSKGDIYHLQVTSPDAQVDRIVELLMPVRDRILGITTGNHEVRSDGHDYAREIAYRLGVEAYHSPISILHIIRVGRKPHNGKPYVYTIHQTHGRGSSTSVGGKATAMDRYGRCILADVVVLSHMHEAMITTSAYFLPDLYNKSLLEKRQVVVLSPSFLEYGSYALQKGYRPQPQSMVELIFYGQEVPFHGKGRGGIEVRTCL